MKFLRMLFLMYQRSSTVSGLLAGFCFTVGAFDNAPFVPWRLMLVILGVMVAYAPLRSDWRTSDLMSRLNEGETITLTNSKTGHSITIPGASKED